jgi:hypothetical protein
MEECAIDEHRPERIATMRRERRDLPCPVDGDDHALRLVDGLPMHAVDDRCCRDQLGCEHGITTRSRHPGASVSRAALVS